MKCNTCKSKKLVSRKRRHKNVYKMISNIPLCSGLTVLELNFQQDCRYDKHVKDKLAKANKRLYVIRSLRRVGCSQLEVDLPNVTYAHFLDRCHKRRYISVRLYVSISLEKQDQKAFKKISQLSTHPLHDRAGPKD